MTPRVEVVFFREGEKTVLMRDWLDSISKKAQANCLAKLGRLEELGNELRRPEADCLRDDIFELRVRLQSVKYRILYCFDWRTAAVVSHGIVKRKRVPAKEIDLAIAPKRLFEGDPKAHSE